MASVEKHQVINTIDVKQRQVYWYGFQFWKLIVIFILPEFNIKTYIDTKFKMFLFLSFLNAWEEIKKN